MAIAKVIIKRSTYEYFHIFTKKCDTNKGTEISNILYNVVLKTGVLNSDIYLYGCSVKRETPPFGLEDFINS